MQYGLTPLLVTVLVLLFQQQCVSSEEKSQLDFNYLREIVEKNIEKVGDLIFKGVPASYIKTLKARKKKSPPAKAKPRNIINKSAQATKVKEMFYHAYNSYMMYAFPADELMPLACKGRVRGLTPSRGEVDDVLGRYMLTLIDSLDTLLIMNEIEQFEYAVQLVIGGLSFDTDVTVSLFEANIRVLGGLLGGHAGCLHLQTQGRMAWYEKELLYLAKDLADRMVPAFDTPTGIPVPKFNLRHGMEGINENETCTACAGTLLLEFGALSRYLGNSSYEDLARAALDKLYQSREPETDLPGSVININTGKWVRKDSTVGASTDSYYEYLVKGYIFTGDHTLWDMFEKQYTQIRRYMMKGKYMLTVHAQFVNNRVRDYQDALQAFWPGLQVYAGNISEAAKVHNHYTRVSAQYHHTLPEAFLLDERMYWPQYYLRPELVESAYILYQATKDPKYTELGSQILNAIENRCRVKCGYASLKNVVTGELEDRMDSFLLAETLKYLYLLFAEPNEVGVNMEDYVLNTEAHLIPLFLQKARPVTVKTSTKSVCTNEGIYQWTWLENYVNQRWFKVRDHSTCDPTDEPPIPKNKQTAKQPNVSGQRTITQHLGVAEFDPQDPDHINTLRTMGIQLEKVVGNKVQLVHNTGKAFSEQLAVEGMIFMKEIMEHAKIKEDESKAWAQTNGYKEVFVHSILTNSKALFEAGPAMFGPQLSSTVKLTAPVAVGDPADCCTTLLNDNVVGKIVVAHRGNCMFVEKVRKIEASGAKGAIIIDTSNTPAPPLAMSGDGEDDVNIPALFLHKHDGETLLKMMRNDPLLLVLELRGSEKEAGKCGS